MARNERYGRSNFFFFGNIGTDRSMTKMNRHLLKTVGSLSAGHGTRVIDSFCGSMTTSKASVQVHSDEHKRSHPPMSPILNMPGKGL